MTSLSSCLIMNLQTFVKSRNNNPSDNFSRSPTPRDAPPPSDGSGDLSLDDDSTAVLNNFCADDSCDESLLTDERLNEQLE